MRVVRWPGVVLGVVLGVGFGCGHDARPAVQPDEHPPLPPGTPIGYLIDDAGELQLRDDQVARLKEIDSDLAAHLDVIDAQQRGPGRAAAAAGSGPAGGGRHRGGRRSGMRRGGGGTGSGSAAARPASAAGSVGNANPRTEDRATDVREALARAFAVLDPAQQPIAKRVLSEHGVDLDAGRPAPGHPEAEPDEPDEQGAGSGSGN